MLKRQTNKRLFFTFSFLLLSVCCLLLTQGQPAEGAVEAVGRFTYTEGKVDLLHGGELPAVPAKKGELVNVKDIVRTKSDSKAEILFDDGNILRLAQRTRIDISEYAMDGGATKEVIKLPRGKVEAIVEKKIAQRVAVAPQANRFEIHTPNAVAGVRGTNFFVFHTIITGVIVKSGTVDVLNPKFPNVVVTVKENSFTSVTDKEPPKKSMPVTDEQIKGHDKDVAPSKDTSGDKGQADSGKEGQPGTGTPDTTGTEKKSDSGTGKQDTTGLNKKSESDTGKTTGEKVISVKTAELIQPSVTTNAVFQPPQITTTVIIPVAPTITIPSVEVGRTTLSGALVAGSQLDMNYLSVMMKDVIYLATSSGTKPTIWKTDTISGSYLFGNHLNSGNITNTAINIGNGSNMNGTFQFNQFGGNWAATVNGSGTIGNGTYNGNINMTGTASGTAGGGSFSGIGKGDVK